MKLCGRCGALDTNPDGYCKVCGQKHEIIGTVRPPTGQRIGGESSGNVRTSTKTPRQERDDA